jgi:hypothetical protein
MLWLGVSLIFLIGLGRLRKGLVELRKARQVLRWPTVPGVVTLSKLTTHMGRDGLNFTSVVEYAYTVAGREYRSSMQWADSKVAAARKLAASVTMRYPKGQAVQVYYDPQQPSSAVLEPNVAQFACMYVRGGGLLMLAALALWFITFVKM